MNKTKPKKTSGTDTSAKTHSKYLDILLHDKPTQSSTLPYRQTYQLFVFLKAKAFETRIAFRLNKNRNLFPSRIYSQSFMISYSKLVCKYKWHFLKSICTLSDNVQSSRII